MTDRTKLTFHSGDWIETIDACQLAVGETEGGWRLTFEIAPKATLPEDIEGQRLTFEQAGWRYDIGVGAVVISPSAVQIDAAAFGSSKGRGPVEHDDCAPQRLSGEGPNLLFDGQIIGEITTQNRGGSKDRWQEVRLWETRGGAWIVENVGCSTREGEREFRSATVVEASDTEMEMRLAVMEWLEWSPPARELSRAMEWKFNRWVD